MRKRQAESKPLLGAAGAPDGTDTIIRLGPSLQIKDVEQAREVLMAALSAGARVAVDVGPIDAVDTAGVQLLLALPLEARKRGVAAEFQGESTALESALVALGLVGHWRAAARDPARPGMAAVKFSDKT
jgi:anti-anti-sigma regulatory factor